MVVESFLELQKRQVVHDRDHHRDIFHLPSPGRMTHFTLHFAKYVGRLAQPAVPAELAHRTLADCFIVTLAAADVLNLDLSYELGGLLDSKTMNEAEVAASLRIALPAARPELQREWGVQLALITGEMAKAMESLDHMEAIDTRSMLRDAVVNLAILHLAVARALGVSTPELIERRWDEIARRRVT